CVHESAIGIPIIPPCVHESAIGIPIKRYHLARFPHRVGTPGHDEIGVNRLSRPPLKGEGVG
ncbi:MAG: hypothetical protein KDI62_10620, partial [Anaerolineae bacterium]|nr:hypothetical protein [Anaerolineae bacterium]